MTARQNDSLRTLRTLKAAIEANPKVLEDYPALAAYLQQLSTKISEIEAASEAQDNLAKGQGTLVAGLKAQLAQRTFAIAGPLANYAADNGLADMEARVAYTFSKLERMDMAELVRKARQVQKDAGDNLAHLAGTGVTADDLAGLSALIEGYDAKNTVPAQKIKQRKTETEALPRLFREAWTIVRRRMQNLLGKIGEKHPKFVAIFENAAKIQALSGRPQPAEPKKAPKPTTPDASAKSVEAAPLETSEPLVLASDGGI